MNFKKKHGYYKKYENTIELDVTDCHSVEESTLKLLKFIEM